MDVMSINFKPLFKQRLWFQHPDAKRIHVYHTSAQNRICRDAVYLVTDGTHGITSYIDGRQFAWSQSISKLQSFQASQR